MPGLGSTTGALTVTNNPPIPVVNTLTAPSGISGGAVSGMMTTYIAVDSGNVYQFAGFLQNPDGTGNTTSGTYNGETVVWVNRDGGIERGHTIGVPTGATSNLSDVNNVYNAYTTSSVWESEA